MPVDYHCCDRPPAHFPGRARFQCIPIYHRRSPRSYSWKDERPYYRCDRDRVSPLVLPNTSIRGRNSDRIDPPLFVVTLVGWRLVAVLVGQRSWRRRYQSPSSISSRSLQWLLIETMMYRHGSDSDIRRGTTVFGRPLVSIFYDGPFQHFHLDWRRSLVPPVLLRYNVRPIPNPAIGWIAVVSSASYRR